MKALLHKGGALPCSLFLALCASPALADVKPDSGDYAALPPGTAVPALQPVPVPVIVTDVPANVMAVARTPDCAPVGSWLPGTPPR